MKFCSEAAERVNSYLVHVPQQVRAFTGDLTGVNVLDVGCGDMVPDIGLLSLAVKHIHGLDVVRDFDPIRSAVEQVQAAGFPLPPDYRSRLSYTAYNGSQFPFPDNHFDFVFSWSAFEHIPDVPGALKEIRRVVKPLGRVFLQVYPWFHTLPGSHLIDYIPEPFFHLTRPPEWVHERLQEYAAQHPETSAFVLEHMWPEYCRLNGYSARRFLTEVVNAGFCIDKLEATVSEDRFENTPPGIAIADLVTTGTKVLVRPGKPFSEEQLTLTQLRKTTLELESALAAERAKLKGIEESQSWRITAPLRALMEVVRARRK